MRIARVGSYHPTVITIRSRGDRGERHRDGCICFKEIIHRRRGVTLDLSVIGIARRVTKTKNEGHGRRLKSKVNGLVNMQIADGGERVRSFKSLPFQLPATTRDQTFSSRAFRKSSQSLDRPIYGPRRWSGIPRPESS